MAQDNQFAYDADPIRCHACATKEKKAEQFHRAGGDPHGLMFTITKESDGR
jgi:hypothetical protein